MIAKTETIYRCDICQKEGPWVKGQWYAVTYGMKSGYDGWEHEFHVCSESCDIKLRNMSKAEKRKLIKPSSPTS